MVGRTVMVAACACLAIVGALGLASWLASEAPREAGPGDLDGIPVGSRVRMTGVVEEVLVLGGDFCLLHLTGEDGNSSPVLLSFPAPVLHPGDRIRVTGRVAVYRGTPEVVVDRREDLDLLGGPGGPKVDLDELMAGPWRFEGTEPEVPIVVSGPPVADDGGRGWWCLVMDAGGTGEAMAVLLMGEDLSPVPLGTGAELTVRVAVRYDPTTGLVYLEALEVL